MKKLPAPDIFICDCHSPDHQFIINYDEDKDEETGISYSIVYIAPHLSKLPLFKRIKYAFKYIFGHQCRYGAFDEIILNPDDAPRLQKVVDYLKKSKK